MSDADDESESERRSRLFREAVGDARPLSQNQIAPFRRKRRPVPEQSRQDEREVIENLLSDEYQPADVETGDELLFKRPGVQHNVMRKLRRGHYAIQAELDLHRCTAVEARDLIARFLRDAQLLGHRCVRIIHGKGLGSPGKLPVLKNKVNTWLRQRDEVLAFSSAQPHHGGGGAVYVLLKGKR